MKKYNIQHTTYNILHKLRLRTWISIGIIVVLTPLVFAMVYGVFGATGGSSADPVAVWHFDEATDNTCSGGTNDVCDASGNGNDGAFGATTAAPSWRTEDLCVSGKCLYFDGTNDTITVSNTISNVRTVVFWVKPMTASEEFMALNGSVNITVSSGTVTATGFTSPTIYVNGKVSSTLTANSHWQHVAVTTATGISASTITIGNVSTNFGNIFMDEVKLFTTTLTADQVRAEFAGGAAVFGDTREFLNQGLAGYWNMDQTSGNATDRSGNGVTLTNNGTTPYNGAKFGNGPTFNGSTRFFSTATTISNTQTIAFWANPANVTDNYANLASGVYVSSSSGAITATGFTNPIYYINGVQTTSPTISASTWTHVTITTTTPITANAFEVGRANATVAVNNSQMDDIRVYNRALSPSEVKKLYNWAPGPVGYWNLDEGSGTTVFDRSGNGTTLTNSGMDDTNWLPGKFGNAIEYRGSGQYSSGPNNMPLTQYSYTWSAWVYINAFGGSTFRDVMSVLNGTQILFGGGFDTSSGSGENAFYCYQDNVAEVTGPFIFALNTWYYISCIYNSNNNTLTMYVNGVFNNQETMVGQGTTAGSDIYLGRGFDSGTEIEGRLDDVRIYNYALTPSQIIEDMNAGHPLGGSPLGSQIIYWAFDETAGNTINNKIAQYSSITGARNSATWLTDANCKLNSCLNFSGTTHNVAGGSPTFFNGLAQMSVSAWINPQSLATDRTIVSKHDNSSNAFAIRTDNSNSGELRVQIANAATDTSNYFLTSNFGMTTSEGWIHLLVVYDGTQSAANRITVYKNGRQVAGSVTGTIPTSIRTSTAAFRVGQAAATYSSLIAYIDEVKVYAAALTPEQVLVDKNYGSIASFSAGSREINDVAGGPGTGPIGWWKLDENTGQNVFDSSGNNANGTLGATSGSGTDDPIWIPGRLGSALLFDGVNDHVLIPHTSSLNITTTNLSMSAWVWRSSTNSTDNILRKKLTGDGTVCGSSFDVGYALTIWSTNEIGAFICDGTNGFETYTDPGIVTTNRWHHIVATFNRATPANSRIYLNGQSVSITSGGTMPTGSLANTSDFMIGIIGGGGNPFDGKLDEVKVFDYALTPAQVAYEYNRGAPTAHWKLDECTGTTVFNSAKDARGLAAGNNGTLTVGGSGSQTSAGDCSTSASTAWYNGRNGKFNGSLNFDGTDDYVDFGDLTFTESYATLSWSMWVRPSSLATGRCIFCKANATTQQAWRIWTDSTTSTTLRVNIPTSTSDTSTYGTVTNALANDEWIHIAAVYDGLQTGNANRLRIFINGKEQTVSFTGTIPAATTATTSNARLAADSAATSGTFFAGQIDDVRVYNFSLSQAQILKIINEGSAVRFGPQN